MPKDKRKNTRKDAKAKATCNRCDKPPGGGVDEGRDNGHGAHPSPTSPTTFHIPPTSYGFTCKVTVDPTPATRFDDHKFMDQYHANELRRQEADLRNKRIKEAQSMVAGMAYSWVTTPIITNPSRPATMEDVSKLGKSFSELEHTFKNIKTRHDSICSDVERLNIAASRKPHDESPMLAAIFGAFLASSVTCFLMLMVSCAQ